MRYSNAVARWINLLALLAGIYSVYANAALIELDFQQGGFEGGGTLEAQVVAEDGNGDGRISSLDGEVETLTLQLVGNAIFRARPIYLSGAEIDFVYDLDGGPLGDSADEGLRAIIDDVGYLTGFGTLSSACGSEPLCAEYFGPTRSIFSSVPLLVVNEPIMGVLSLAMCLVLMGRRTIRPA